LPQGFGKKRNSVSMAKPRKKKVAARQDFVSDMDAADKIVDEEPEESCALEPAPTPPSPNTEEREEAHLELKVRRAVWERFRVDARRASAQLTAAEHLYAAKMKRIDAMQRRKTGSGFNEMYRIHKAITARAEALLHRERAAKVERECAAEYHEQQSLVLRLDNAKLRPLCADCCIA